MCNDVRAHDSTGPPAARIRKHPLAKVGAILAGAMLVVGGISFFDPASASDYEYEFGPWTDTQITQETGTKTPPYDKDYADGENDPNNTKQWVLVDGPTYPYREYGTETYPGLLSEPPDASWGTEYHGDDVLDVGAWTRIPSSRVRVYTEGDDGPDVYSHTDYAWGRVLILRGDPVYHWVLQARRVERVPT